MFARTRRLTLRPGWPEDAAAVTHAIGHEAVAMKLARVPWPYTEADARWWLELPRGHDDVLCLILAHDLPATATTAGVADVPTLVGMIGLHPIGAGGAHELGYWLTPAAWGRGYATEAGHAMLAIAERSLGLKRLAASHFLDNPASGRVLAKLGFRRTGTARQFSRARGTDADCATFTLDFADGEPEQPLPIAA